MDKKILGIVSAVILAAIFLGVIGSVTAHSQQTGVQQEQTDGGNNNGHCPMHSSMAKGMPCTGMGAGEMDGGMSGCPMHEAMAKGMPCMALSEDEMDSDKDGFCDFCGMPVEQCNAMMQNNGVGNNVAMHSMMHGMKH